MAKIHISAWAINKRMVTKTFTTFAVAVFNEAPACVLTSALIRPALTSSHTWMETEKNEDICFPDTYEKNE